MWSETTRPADTARPGQNGLAELALARRAGRTRLTRLRTRPPLLVQQALYPDEGAPDMAYVFLANPTGGMLAGDRQEIRVTVSAGAKAHVTTQSATKLHTMPDGVAEQSVEIVVQSNGYLEYLPDPLIPFRDASLEQRVNITLEPGASLLYGDVITPGRVASGESFVYRRFSNRLTVQREPGGQVYREAFALTPLANDPLRPGVLGPPEPDGTYSVHGRTLASVLILCDGERARPILNQLRGLMPAWTNTPAGATLLSDGNGVGIKIIGPYCAAVQSSAVQVWSIARQELLGVAAPFLRKY